MKQSGALRRFLLLIFIFYSVPVSFSQNITFSLPQKISAGSAKIEILGKTSEGILVYNQGRSNEVIEALYDNLQQRWKKNLSPKEKNARTEHIVVSGDSLLIFYTVAIKGNVILKAYKTSVKLESFQLPVVCDTLTSTSIIGAPVVQVITSPDKKTILIYYTLNDFSENPIVHTLCFSSDLQLLWEANVKARALLSPVLVEALVDNAGNSFVVFGESNSRSLNNDFPFSTFQLQQVRNGGIAESEVFLDVPNEYLSTAQIRWDAVNNCLLFAGLYADETGNESNGIYFFSFDLISDSLKIRNLTEHSATLLTLLSGNDPPKKGDGFYDFRPAELVVKQNGGVIFICESFAQEADSYTHPSSGSFGLTSGFTVNFFHYDELAVWSLNQDGTVEWQQILHKKQQTEGDGGFYSSFATMVDASALHFVFNDLSGNQANVTSYDISASGEFQRRELFNAERKGVMVIPRLGRQVSASELLLPSIKRNYLQFVKITF